MLTAVFLVNLTIFFLFLTFYAYQMYYLYIGWKDKKNDKPMPKAKEEHIFGVVIAARNESAVIGELIKSIHAQNYPQEKIKIFIIADNCTDNTADISRKLGATVFERNNLDLIGKGYALNFGFDYMLEDPSMKVDAFIILDADNLLNENYIAEINKVYDAGYLASTSYRNSKNYAQNWITAGYGLWFLREAEFLNRPRFVLGNSCAISGTGFMLAYDLIKDMGGWHYHTLTEDIEFSVSSALRGGQIGYAKDAMLYDEQPITFKQSWDQRLRWAKGFYQVLGKYGGSLIKGTFTKRERERFSIYDMMMTIAPALFVTLACIVVNVIFLCIGVLTPDPALSAPLIKATLQALGMSIFLYYMTLFIVGALTTYTEWDNILASKKAKIRAMFMFPLFMLTYIPIAIVAIFKKVEWRPINHSVVTSIEELEEGNR